MPDDQTKLIISLETILRGVERTLKGLDRVEKKLKSVAAVKVTQQSSQASDKAALAAQRLAQQQQKLVIQAQVLTNRQERARQMTERLALSQQRLAQAQQRVTRATSAQADAHVRAFRAIQRGIADANTHVQFFRANEAALAKAPQMDAHVRAFRTIEEGSKRANQQLVSLGNSFRSIGQGLASFGATLAVTLTAPLAALGTVSVSSAVQLDSLKRGLTAITGSSSEAATQLARLTEIAKLPGIGFEEAIQGSIRLQAVGFSAADAEKALIQFSNAVALTGGGRDELARITVQLGQLAAKGKVLSQDLRPIIEAAPAVGRALKQAFGTVNADDIAEMTTSSREFLDVLVSELTRLPRAAAGARNAFENFRDTLFRAAAAIGDALLPTLTKLIEVAGPIISTLAEGFKALPGPMRLSLVVLGGLLAALGPVAFIVGQLTTGIGRVIVGLAQLNAQGLLPTIANLRLLSAAATTTSASLTSLRTASVAAGAGLAGLVVQLGLGLLAYAAFNESQKKAVTVSEDQIRSTEQQVAALKDQLKFLNSLEGGVKRTADEQERLDEIYHSLNLAAQTRVAGVANETEQLVALRAEIERLLQLRLQEREQQIAIAAGGLASALQQIEANEKEIESNLKRVQAHAQLAQSLEKTGTITAENGRLLVQYGVDTLSAAQAIQQLQSRSLGLVSANQELRESIGGPDGLNQQAQQQAAILKALGINSADSARQFLTLARAMGLFKGDVEAALPILERFIQLQNEGTEATNRLRKALSEQSQELLKAGSDADDAEKARQKLIKSAASLAREAASDFAGAVKFMRAFIAANPDLEAALKRQAQIEGKSVEEIVTKALGGEQGKRGTALRNAQQALAKSLEEVALASAEKLKTIEQNVIEERLRTNELGFRKQLFSYRQYLEARAAFTVEALDKEIEQEALRVKSARETQARLLAAAAQRGIPSVERERRKQQAAEADERAIRAETKLAELEARRTEVNDNLKLVLAETAIQQERDVRQLEIEYAELQGRIESAFRAETIERFREVLKDLGDEQVFLAEQLQRVNITAEERKLIQVKQEQNQRQIELIRNYTLTQDALAELAAAEQLITNAKQKQSELEQQIAFDVAFRGQSEEEAIRRRLEGEARVAGSLRLARDIVADTIKRLTDLGLTPPKGLIDFVTETTAAIQGLGELPFVEQFRLAQKEFERLNDERIRKIQEVERAVAHRDISELQGRIAIKAANGEYIGALQQQLELLQRIAIASGDEGLRRQADDAATTTAEVRDATTEMAEFDKAVRSVSIDALHDSFGDFLNSLRHGADAAREALLGMLDSVISRINQLIADRLFEQLFGGLFKEPPIGQQAPGLAAGGLGTAVAAEQAGATAAAVALTTGATAASAAMTSGGAAAGTAMASGGASAAATLVASLAGAAASFSAAVVAAGAAFAAAVAAAAGAQAAGGLGSALGGGAATGLFADVPRGVVRVLEGGYPEAILTTDPRHAARQVDILREYLAYTKGLFGRVPGFATGSMVSRETSEANLLNSIVRAPSSLNHVPEAAFESGGGGDVSLRILNQVSSRDLVRPYLTSEGGVQDVLNIISRNSNDVFRRLGVRRN